MRRFACEKVSVKCSGPGKVTSLCQQACLLEIPLPDMLGIEIAVPGQLRQQLKRSIIMPGQTGRTSMEDQEIRRRCTALIFTKRQSVMNAAAINHPLQVRGIRHG